MPRSLKDVAKPKMTPAAVAVKRFLDSRPSDLVFTRKEVMAAVHYSQSTMQRIEEFLPDYFHFAGNHRGGMLFGNRKAIASLKRQLEVV